MRSKPTCEDESTIRSRFAEHIPAGNKTGYCKESTTSQASLAGKVASNVAMAPRQTTLPVTKTLELPAASTQPCLCQPLCCRSCAFVESRRMSPVRPSRYSQRSLRESQSVRLKPTRAVSRNLASQMWQRCAAHSALRLSSGLRLSRRFGYCSCRRVYEVLRLRTT